MTASGKSAVYLSEDEQQATVWLSGRSEPVVAGVLGVERDKAGQPAMIYLDTRIHQPDDEPAGPWRMTGAVSTILTRSA